MKIREKMLERELARLAGENWQASHFTSFIQHELCDFHFIVIMCLSYTNLRQLTLLH